MEKLVTSQLTALSHPQRLAVFRLLVRRFPDDVRAGEISESLSFRSNTCSVYLSSLLEAGLISQRRQGTSLLYRANLDSARLLLQFLFSDCCRDRVDTGPVQYRFEPVTIPTTKSAKYNVLFACTGNSARSICAEAILRDIAPDRFNVFSAGTYPEKAPNPLVLEMLASKGHPVARLYSKDLGLFQREQAPQMHFVITLCNEAANEDCPAWSGQPLNSHWGLPDPSEIKGSLTERRQAFDRTYQVLKTKIERLARLDLHSLPRIDLQRALDTIGAKADGISEK